ncbi:MAG: efflux RND transporter periplasmic adaptor subunit [Acidobacteriota bacterium]
MNDQADKLSDLRIDDQDRRGDGGGRGLRLGLALLLLVLALAVAWWWLRPRAVEVTTTALAVEGAGRPSAAVLDASGYVVARRRATVSSKITGKIVEVLVDEGLAVKQGQVLARLDPASPERRLRLAEAEVESARSAVAETDVLLADARRTLARSRSLAEREIVSQSDLDADIAAVDALEARLALGREQIAVAERRVAVDRQSLDDTVVRAPFDGIVVTKDAQPGEMISPVSAGGGFTRTGICTLVDMSSLEIEVDVNEAFINRVRPAQPVRAILNAYPEWSIPASVITTVPTADRQRATVRVRIAFDELDPRILPEMGVKVAFLESAAEEPALAAEPTRRWLDRRAVRRVDGESVVFVVADGVARRRPVTLGSERSGRVDVLEGLEPAETVVLEAPSELTDGVAVRY